MATSFFVKIYLLFVIFLALSTATAARGAFSRAGGHIGTADAFFPAFFRLDDVENGDAYDEENGG